MAARAEGGELALIRDPRGPRPLPRSSGLIGDTTIAPGLIYDTGEHGTVARADGMGPESVGGLNVLLLIRRWVGSTPILLLSSALVLALATAGCVTTAIQDAAGSATALASRLGSSMPTSVSGASQAGASSSVDDSGAVLTPAEERLRRQSQAFQRTVWEGALIGAGAGALWGAIAGDDTRGILTKTAIGGAAGGLAGAYIASKQKSFASEEDQLDSMIADVQRSNREAEDLIASLREVIAEDRDRLAAVERRYRAGQATEAEVAATRKRVAVNRSIAQNAANGAREQYAMYSGAERSFQGKNPNADTNKLRSELKTYQQQIETLDELADSMSVA